MLVQPGTGSHFSVHIEPEGVHYDLPPHGKVLLTFIAPDTGIQYFDVAHHLHALIIWRLADTEVWATLADGTRK